MPPPTTTTSTLVAAGGGEWERPAETRMSFIVLTEQQAEVRRGSRHSRDRRSELPPHAMVTGECRELTERSYYSVHWEVRRLEGVGVIKKTLKFYKFLNLYLYGVTSFFKPMFGNVQCAQDVLLYGLYSLPKSLQFIDVDGGDENELILILSFSIFIHV